MTRICPKCGYENPDNRDFCARPGCNEYLRWEQTVMVPAVSRPPPAIEPEPPAAAGAPPAAEPLPPEPPAPEPPVSVPPPREPPAAPAPPPPPPAPGDGDGRHTLVAPGRPPERPRTLLAYRGEEDEGYRTEPLRLRVEPGEDVGVFVLVRNQDAIVDNYDMEVTGLPAAWATVTPPTVHLLPFSAGSDYEREVHVRLHPPRSPEAEAREWPLRIVAVSKAHGDVAASLPCALEIGRFHELAAGVVPERATGRRRGKFRLAVRNGGNGTALVGVSGEDEQANLRYAFDSPQLSLARGAERRTGVRVRPPRPLWFGRGVERPFHLVSRPLDVPGAEPLRTRAVLRQKALIPPWTVLLLPLLVVAAVLAFFLIYNRVEVPQLRGVRGEFQAEKVLKDRGLELGKVTREVKRKVKPGTIFAQDVDAGTKVGRGKAIGVKVALGAGTAKVPDVRGKIVPVATQRLEEAGFSVKRQVPEPAQPLRQRVVRQVPPAGTTQRRGAGVTLFFGPPPKADGGEAPDVGGKPLAEALNALTRAGIAAVTLKAFSETVPAGAVVSQEPPPGEDIPEGQPLKLTVSAGYPRIAFDDGRSLVVADGAGRGSPRRLPPAPGSSNTQPSWSPDGTWIAFRRGDETSGRIFRVDADDLRGARPLTPPGADDGRPAVSPDGRVVAFIRSEPETAAKVCLVRLAAAPAAGACLDAPAELVARPAWSRDGRTLIVLAVLDDQQQVEVLAFRSSTPSSPRRDDWRPRAILTDGVGHGDQPGDTVASAALSPAGPRRLAVMTNWGGSTGGAFRLFAGPVDGRAIPQELAPVGALFGCEVAWRSDGLAVAIANHAPCDQATSGEVRVVELAKPDPRPLPVPGANPAWEPVALER